MLQWVDETLRNVSGGVRTWQTTRIFDIRPFRDAGGRENNNAKRKRRDKGAYHAFENMIHLAKPDVILVCQCQTAKVENELARTLSSSIASAGTIRLLQILDKKTIIVHGFHPSYFIRCLWDEDDLSAENPEQEQKRLQKLLAPFSECSLEFAFAAAINAAAGFRITGLGQYNLSKCSLKGPIASDGFVEDERGEKRDAIMFSCEWMNKDDIASPELIRRVEEILGVDLLRKKVSHPVPMSTLRLLTLRRMTPKSRN